MKSTTPFVLLATIAALVACGGQGAEEATEPDTTAQEERVLSVPDSTIEREVQARLDSDPRLDKEGVEIAVHATDGEVTLVGEVPSRLEMSIAREVAISSPGVRRVLLDSLEVASERREEPKTRA